MSKIESDIEERRACGEAMLATGLDEWEFSLWNTGKGQNDSLDGYMDGWLARARLQPIAPIHAIEAATDALQVMLDAIDEEMAESAIKSALLANDRVNVASQISTLREFVRQEQERRKPQSTRAPENVQ